MISLLVQALPPQHLSTSPPIQTRHFKSPVQAQWAVYKANLCALSSLLAGTGRDCRPQDG